MITKSLTQEVDIMKTVEKTLKVYITEDGKEFTSESEAVAHEKSQKGLKYYTVRYSPDLTEGRMASQRTGLVKISGFFDSEMEIAEFACERAFGGSYAFVQGVFDSNAIMRNFAVSKATQEDIAKYDTVIIVQSRFAKNRLMDEDGIYRLDTFPEKKTVKVY
jgi:hypothetical protein